MGDGYRVSSSVRVEQMEAELSQQVSALQEQIEENDTRTFKYYRCECFNRIYSNFLILDEKNPVELKKVI